MVYDTVALVHFASDHRGKLFFCVGAVRAGAVDYGDVLRRDVGERLEEPGEEAVTG